MRWTLVVAVGLLACGSATRGWSDEDPPALGADDLARAAAAFSHSCAKCHEPPDERFATDRAWLEQIRDTA